MAVEVDASSPARWTDTTTAITSAAFTAPTDALLVLCHEYNGGGGNTSTSVTDTGSLTWTKRVEREDNETTAGGGAAIWTARTTSSVSRTVTANTGFAERNSAKLYVVTGADVNGTPVDTVSASNESGSLTNDYTTTALTPGATGFLFAADCDWNALGLFDTVNTDLTMSTDHWGAVVSVADGYKVCTSGVSVTARLNANGAGAAQHKECRIIVREAAAPNAAYLKPIRRPFMFKPGYGNQRRR